MKVCVFGLWHLGCVTAACVAEAGHEVAALDTDGGIVERLREGVPPLFEPGLAELLMQGHAAGHLTFTTDVSAVAGADLVWVCHDTPVNEDDHADVAHVVDQVRATFPYLRDGTVVLVSAQLPVGTIAMLELALRKEAPGRAVDFACSPENLRLGQALAIFRNPGRIVVGVRTPRARQVLEPLLRQFCDSLIWTSIESAEMTKHALNAFLAVSVTFTNEIAAICEQVGADAIEVETALRSDPRVGPNAYVRPGPAFAGGTLARDIQFLSQIAQRVQVGAPLIGSVIPSNRAHRQWAINQLRRRLQPLQGRRIAVLGIAYKPGTDAIRRSAAIELLRDLVEEGAEVSAFDPAAGQLPRHFDNKVRLAPDIASALSGAASVVIATEWPEFRALAPADLAGVADGCLILDPSRHLDPAIAKDQRLTVISIGTPQ
jgi:UDPglucose 6-dehydrogenase